MWQMIHTYMSKLVTAKALTSEVLWGLVHTKWSSVISKRVCLLQVDLEFIVTAMKGDSSKFSNDLGQNAWEK